LEKAPRGSALNTAPAAELAQVQQQLQALQADKAGLAKLLEEKTASAQSLGTELGALQQKLAQAEQQSAELAGKQEAQERMLQQLNTENLGLTDRARLAEEALTARQAKPAVDQTGPLKQQLAVMREQADGLIRENHALTTRARSDTQQAQARIASLENELRQAHKQTTGNAAGMDDLKLQLAEAMQASTSANAAINELKTAAIGTAEELAQQKAVLADAQRELQLARQGSAAADQLREELTALRGTAAEGTARLEQVLAENKALAEQVGSEHDGAGQAQARVAAMATKLAQAQRTSADQSTALANLKQQLAAAEQARQLSEAQVADLTAANDRLDSTLRTARQGTADSGALREELATLREANSRLSKAADDASALRLKHDQLVQDNVQLTETVSTTRGELGQLQARAAELGKQLEEARTIRTRGGDDTKKLQGELAEAGQSVEKLTATVADLTAANDRLEKDLENERKSTAAALAAQSQAVTAARPDAYQMEISTLQAHIKEVEGQMEEERSNTAKEIATMAAQLQRTRDTNKALTDANRALVNARQSEQPTVDKDQYDQLQSKLGDLTAGADEMRRQNRKLTDEVQRITSEREALKQQLDDAHKVASVMPGLADEKAALQERLEAVGTQLVKTQQELEGLQKQSAEVTAQAAASKQAADKAQADLLALQNRTAEAEKASESHGATAAELTQINTKLETEREDMRRLVESYRADINRLTVSVRTAEQQRVEADRGAQQSVDAVTAQLGQLRRELENARTAQSRIVEANTAQERERVAIITQLRTENGALAARLNQAQGTLDQIAAAARLGTPASTIAAGGTPLVRPVTLSPAPAAEVRYHTVVEGDSLSRISLRYYGTPSRWQEIFNANRDVLQGSSALRVGMQLRIP
jgi:chromosome segregation ATPase